MKVIKIICAEDGKILTNGETYGSWIKLAEGIDEKDFREITEEEYERLMLERNSDIEV